MSGAHTKGPWRVDAFNEVLAGDDCLEAMVIGQGDYIVAQMVPERDAHLIAAAPELLEALEEFQRHVIRHSCSWDDSENASHHHPIWVNVAETIAKARGAA